MAISKEYIEELRALAVMMRQVGLVRLRSYCYGLDLELHPSVFAPAPPIAPPEAAQHSSDQCACTHSLEVEHNPTGCLRGCPAELCATTGAKG